LFVQMQCPLLCKEFVIDAWQIYYARSKGADAILLIAAVLPDLDMKYMLRVCKSLGMTALIEVCLKCFGLRSIPTNTVCTTQF
jgi:indole-3-glycerol phosphate synthase